VTEGSGAYLRVFAGSEAFLLRTLRAGGQGCISATANVNPARIVEVGGYSFTVLRGPAALIVGLSFLLVPSLSGGFPSPCLSLVDPASIRQDSIFLSPPLPVFYHPPLLPLL
jgi:hypothetical protein